MEDKQLSDDARAIKDMLAKLEAGAKPEEVKDLFAKVFANKDVSHISNAEKELRVHQSPCSNMSSFCDVHMLALQDESSGVSVPEFEFFPPHPLAYFKLDGLALMDLFRETIRPCIHGGLSPELLPQNLKAFYEAVDLHIAKKESVLFSYLDKKGISGPTRTMWEVDDQIKEGIKKGIAAAEAESPVNVRAVVEHMHKTVGILRDQLNKEEAVLIPLVAQELSDQELYEASQEMLKIGYNFENPCAWEPEGITKTQANPSPAPASNLGFMIQFETGALNFEQIDAILNTMGCEITFVDADDIFRYYSNLDHMYFLRTKADLGRHVYDCHPEKSKKRVKMVLDALRSGEKDVVSVPASKAGKDFIVSYKALRNKQGQYLGCLELIREANVGQ